MTSDFEVMLLRDDALPIHIRKVQLLMTGIYKTKRGLHPSFMKEIFVEKHIPRGLRSCHNMLQPQALTACCGLEATSQCCETAQGGALSTCTYGEVSPIFLGQNISKSDIFGSK